MLKATIKVCEENGITYYCQAGSVLGTIRHGGPIPWDSDADLIIPNDQIDRFVECAGRCLPEEFYVDYFKLNSKSLRQFPRIGVKGKTTNSLHVDIFRLIGLPDDTETRLAMIEEARSYTQQNALMRKPIWKLGLKGNFKYLRDKIRDRCMYIKKFDKICNRYPYVSATYVMNPSGKYGKKNIFEKKVYGEGQTKKYLDFEVRIPSVYDFYLRQYYGNYMKIPPQEEIDKAMNKKYDVR